MAAQGGIAFQEKVSRLLNRKDGKPVLKPNKPLVLKDYVASRRPRKGEASCIPEITAMMACWKLNNFVEGPCSNEMNSFFICAEKAQADVKNKSNLTSIEGGRLHPKQATTLLKRFPNLLSEI